jgi:tRNA-dihydrouridine synthase A
MQDAVPLPITVKHRIGIDWTEDYGFARDFVGALFAAGCRVFIVHARNAWLKGMSPKENREIPPLRYPVVHQLKQDFRAAVFVLNGGLTSLQQAAEHTAELDGVMLGRAAYHDPYLLAGVDRAFYGATTASPTREEVVAAMNSYLQAHAAILAAPCRATCTAVPGVGGGAPAAACWSDAVELERYGRHPAAGVGRSDSGARLRQDHRNRLTQCGQSRATSASRRLMSRSAFCIFSTVVARA